MGCETSFNVFASANHWNSSPFGTTYSGRKRRPSDSYDEEDPILDDCAAAMVLMSLSCSPKSPLFPVGDQGASNSLGLLQLVHFLTDHPLRCPGRFSKSWTQAFGGSSVDSGLAWPGSGRHSSRTTTPSPPSVASSNSSHMAPKAEIRTSPAHSDEGLELDENSVVFASELHAR